ncbi:hypothetical protein [Arachnia propionica]|uniref:hypothetical protein n=1 Tax=Arachnia propionica TaxID=1750 RepID=UPI000F64CB10|nr:hypothetical protein [Arachnia propionica]
MWEDDRAMRMRAEVLHPLAADLDAQVRAEQQWRQHHEAAVACVAVIEERLDEAQNHMTPCAEAERQARQELLDAANAIESGMRAVETCTDRCLRALRALEAAVPCGGKVPVSLGDWAEIGWLVTKAGVRACVEQGTKQVASNLIEDGVAGVLRAEAPPYTHEVSEQVLDQVIDAGRLTAVRSRAWWERFRKRRDRR